MVRALFRRPWRILAAALLLAVTAAGLAPAFFYFSARHELAIAQSEEDCGRLADARRHADRSLTFWASSGDAHLLAGRLSRRLGDFKTATRHFERARQLQGESEALTLEQVLLHAQTGQMERWAPHLRSLVAANHPQTHLILEAMARGYMQAYRLHEAGLLLKLWLEKQPDSLQALLSEGWVLELSGNRDLAAANYERVLQLDPENDEAHARLAILCEANNAPDKATPHLRYLLRRQPDSATLTVLLAKCEFAEGQFETAHTLLDGVLARDPENALALAIRGNLALTEGTDLDRAEQWLRHAVVRNPSDYQTQYQLWLCLRQAGKEDEARRQEQVIRQLDEDRKRLHEILVSRMSERSGDPAVHYEAGVLFLRSGEVAQGVRWLESALARDPHYRPAHVALADFYARAGDDQRAAYHRRLADLGGAAAW